MAFTSAKNLEGSIIYKMILINDDWLRDDGIGSRFVEGRDLQSKIYELSQKLEQDDRKIIYLVNKQYLPISVSFGKYLKVLSVINFGIGSMRYFAEIGDFIRSEKILTNLRDCTLPTIGMIYNDNYLNDNKIPDRYQVWYDLASDRIDEAGKERIKILKRKGESGGKLK